ncbi:phosphate uptake regulator PhoU [Candidatus Woesearchaeota archaeon]|nr:phosphate uptake regulator PhoU [Candidatus Woesearchaeota archaeon]
MKRKVIQIAGSTQLVSLPRAWAKRNNIQKGQEVDVEEDGDKVIVSTTNAPKKSVIEIDLSGITPRLADRFLARAYQLGYDELIINYDSLDVAAAIQQKVPELLGFDIYEQTKNRFVIKSISSRLEIDFDSALRKAFLIATSMADLCLEAASQKDIKALEHIRYRDLDLNKFCYFCLRAINKNQYKGHDNRILYYLVETLEDVGDSYKELADNLAKKGVTDKLIKAITKVNNVFKLSYEFFYKPDKGKVVDTYNKLKETENYIHNLFKTHEPVEGRAIATLDYLLRLVYHFTTMRLDTLGELETK